MSEGHVFPERIHSDAEDANEGDDMSERFTMPDRQSHLEMSLLLAKPIEAAEQQCKIWLNEISHAKAEIIGQHDPCEYGRLEREIGCLLETFAALESASRSLRNLWVWPKEEK